jgi:hypothetical protein
MNVGAPSFAGLLHEIIGSIRDLIRLEIRLAKVEVGESLLSARQAVVILIASTCGLLLAAGALLLAAVYALSLAMAPWAAALTVAGVTASAGGLGMFLAVLKFRQVGIPKRTSASLQETMS